MNEVERELQKSRKLAVQRLVSEATRLAYELGKDNARMRYSYDDNPFAHYAVHEIRLAWANGWNEINHAENT